MSSSEPTRPFESLDWYSRQLRQADGGRSGWLRWLGGIGFLSLHISVFALGMTALFAINLLKDAGEIWVDRVLWAWAILIVVHLVLIGLTVAIGLLRDDDDDAALEIVKDVGWRQAATWPAGQRPVANAHDAEFRVSPPAGGAGEPPPPRAESSGPGSPSNDKPGPAPIWQGWQSGTEPAEPAAGASVDNPSWKEATSWIGRRRRENHRPDDQSTT